jgi:hypothetical protein
VIVERWGKKKKKKKKKKKTYQSVSLRETINLGANVRDRRDFVFFGGRRRQVINLAGERSRFAI